MERWKDIDGGGGWKPSGKGRDLRGPGLGGDREWGALGKSTTCALRGDWVTSTKAVWWSGGMPAKPQGAEE